MRYQTIVLELLHDRSTLHNRLRRLNLQLPTAEQYARQLKASHQDWKKTLVEANPDRDPTSIASEALELALKELEQRLPSESPESEEGTLSLDAAMTFVRRHTPTE